MASNITDSVTNAARSVANRAETVLGDDAREAGKRLKNSVREVRANWRSLTGSNGESKAKKRAPARKSGR
jgi:hypothetical protein